LIRVYVGVLPRMPYADVNHIHMYYEEMGDPNAVPLVLLHGASSAIAMCTATDLGGPGS